MIKRTLQLYYLCHQQMPIPAPDSGGHGAALPPPVLQDLHVRPRHGRPGALH